MENKDLTKEQLIEQIKSLQEKINSLEKTISAQSQVQYALKTSENNLSAILEENADGILIVDTEGTVLYVNPAAEKLFGRRKEDFLGYSFGFPVSSDNELDTLTIRKGGTLIEVELRIVQINWKSQRAYQLSIRDITERKKAEDAIKHSNQLLNDALDIGKLAWWEMNCETGEVLFHERKATMLGYTHENFKHYTDFTTLIHPDDFQPAMDAMSDHLQGKKDLYEIDYRIKTATGDYFWYHDIGKITKRDEDGKPLKVMGMVMNITDRKKALVELTQSEERFRVAFENAGIGMTLVDLQGRLTKSNQALGSILGYSEDEFLNMDFTQFTHPEDIALDLQFYTELIQGKREQYQIQKRFLHKVGNVVWGMLTVSLIRDSSNRPLYAIGMMENITENKRAEEALRQSEVRLRTLVQTIPDLIWLKDVKGIYLSCNTMFEQLFGAKEADIVGKTDYDFVDRELADFFRDHDHKAMAAGKPSSNEEWLTFADDGHRALVETIKAPMYDSEGMLIGVLGIARDITELKKAKETLIRLNQAIENSKEVVFMTDKEGVFTFVNPRFTEMYGFTAEEVLEKETPRILKSDNYKQEDIEQFWKTVLNKQSLSLVQYVNKCKDGRLIDVEASINPIVNEQGEIIGFLALQRDVTERKLAELELIKAKEKAEESDRLKTAFLTNMSHEIRTPMNGILGFTELLKEPDLSSKDQQDYIQFIQISGARMLNTINDIVNISKIEAGLVQIDIKETNINEIIEFTYNFFKPEAESKKLQLSFKNGLQSKESIIKTDNEKVYGILTNLVKNAIKFINEGSIEFGYVKKGEYLEFFVKDTGIGINDKKTEIIFERFRQASESHNRGYEGSGLGLSITKSYVNMLGGEIWVESEEGKGSTFYFTIPYNAVSEEKIITESTFSEKDKEVQLRKLKILIVEDDEISYLLLSLMLQNIDCEILHAITGTEAVEACRTNPDIDLILMDIRIPNMDGIEATRLIRQFNKEVVIIAQTAYAFDGDKEKTIEAGCNSYVIKPIDRTILTELITSYFN